MDNGNGNKGSEMRQRRLVINRSNGVPGENSVYCEKQNYEMNINLCYEHGRDA